VKVSHLPYGVTYSGTKIIVKPQTTDNVGRDDNDKKLNANFVDRNNGNSFTLWSPIDILTDEDFENQSYSVFTKRVENGQATLHLNAARVHERNSKRLVEINQELDKI